MVKILAKIQVHHKGGPWLCPNAFIVDAIYGVFGKLAKYLRPIHILFLAIFPPGALQASAVPPLSYTLTIYVDEGRGSISGHVFVALSDGKNRIFRGFYPQQAREDTFGKIIAPAGAGGGEVRDDVHHRWDVRKTFPITREGFRRAVEVTEQGRTKTWCLLNHCGDFALGVAAAAGVKLDLPRTLTGTDRPSLFGAYLREHGGVTFNEIKDCEDDVRRRAEAAELKLRSCSVCSSKQTEKHLAALHRMRNQDIAACAAKGY